MVLWRIFDSAGKAHSIHKAVNATLGHIEFFSAASLALRKIAGGPKPDWLDTYIANAWVPGGAKDLRHLEKALRPHTKLFYEVYAPIRHSISQVPPC